MLGVSIAQEKEYFLVDVTGVAGRSKVATILCGGYEPPGSKTWSNVAGFLGKDKDNQKR